MHIDLEWPRILTPGYWFPKATPPHRVEQVSIRNIITRGNGEPDGLVAVLVMDGAAVDEDDPEYLDLHQLRLSLASARTFFPWTCSCGVPGCAGMFRGVAVSHNAGNTTWLDLDGDRHFEFSTSKLRRAYSGALLDGARILAATPGLDITPDQNADEYRERVNHERSHS